MELSKLMGCVKRPFIPSELFRGGLIDGAWFDPSDMSTLYQDAAGRIPVTAVEQPVGLMLDKSRGLILGPELVSNGTFDSDTGWTKNTGVTISAGTCNFLAVAVGQGINQSISQSFSTDKKYLVEFEIASYSSGGGISVRLGNVGNFYQVTSSNGKKKLIISAGSTSGFIQFLASDASGSYSIDNISIKELYGNHATQSITASRPTLSARYNLLTKTEDFSNAAWVKEFGGTGSTPVITQNYATAPDGSNTATRIVYALNGGAEHTDFSRVYQPVTIPANTQTVVGVWVKSTTGQAKNISISMTGANPLVVTVGADWVFVSNAMIRSSDNNYLLRFELRGLYGTSDSADILIWHPDLRLGTTSGPYQRVNTATDYDTDERYFPKYLRFDGIDDYLNLPYMGLYANGSASVVMARDEKSTHSIETYTVSERSTLAIAPYYIFDTKPAGVLSCGVIARNDSTTTIANTISAALSSVSNSTVMSYIDNGANIKRFKNSAQATSSNYVRSGTLTPNNTTIGAYVISTGSVGFMNNNLYGLIITKSALTDAQRVACERLLARKAGVTL